MTSLRALAEWLLIGCCTASLICYLFLARPVEVYLSLLGKLMMKTLALAGG